jgi:hypothetical protein
MANQKTSSQDIDALDRVIDMASGAVPKSDLLAEHRGDRRLPMSQKVAFVQRMPDGGKSICTVVQGKDISPGGMCIISRYMLHIGQKGAVLLTRSNGKQVIIGAKVVHCRYVGPAGHESGLEFLDSVDGFTIEDFRDQQGNMPQLGGTDRGLPPSKRG